ncbi:MAG: cytidylate kinase-like family protein [Oscillospiraceae bacterium]|nr:cytidylate kinase-like family protein [Oscillospiraceae bacterium]
MARIITISREFGSGGRELGKRLADALGMPCYDHQIIELIAKENGFDERYVANMSEKSIEAAYPLTIAHTFAMPVLPLMDQSYRVAAAQRRILESFARQGDCVIVGRCADVILQEYHPLRLFVYADTEHKVRRCFARAPEGENLSRKEMERRIRAVERSRAQFREMYSDSKWGSRESCDLCVNTSGREIKELIPGLAAYARCWFDAAEKEQAD